MLNQINASTKLFKSINMKQTIFAILLVLLFSSCQEISNRITNQKIIGKWTCNVAENLENFKEMEGSTEAGKKKMESQEAMNILLTYGLLLMDHKDFSIEMEFTNNGNAFISNSISNEKEAMSYKIDGSSIIFSLNNGNTDVYTIGSDATIYKEGDFQKYILRFVKIKD
jgi:hypothetical protein